ncbi:MAG: MinD/ParA family protein [Phycisphaerae bacterium]|nr:MinD/ParA family protein [Phycisphaerae bacterium]
MKKPIRIHDQAKKTHRQAKVLAVASGKGGVGKTNISANLAICLAQAGKRVLLLDADMSMGNLDVVLNVHSKFNISHVLSGRRQLNEIIHHGPHGIDIICGASGMESLANLTEFQQARLVDDMERLQDNADVLIVDSAAGIARSVVGFCLAADHVLIVTTPDATAMTDAYSMIKVLAANEFDGHMSLVVNMADTQAQAKKTYLQIAKVAKQFLGLTLYYAGSVLYDPNLVAAVRSRTPVITAYPRSQASEAIRMLASRLSSASPSEKQGKPFFRKVVNWFC